MILLHCPAGAVPGDVLYAILGPHGELLWLRLAGFALLGLALRHPRVAGRIIRRRFGFLARPLVRGLRSALRSLALPWTLTSQLRSTLRSQLRQLGERALWVVAVAIVAVGETLRQQARQDRLPQGILCDPRPLRDPGLADVLATVPSRPPLLGALVAIVQACGHGWAK